MSSADSDSVRHIHAPRWWRQWPIIVVLTGVGIALALVALDYFRRGSVVLAGCTQLT